MSGTANYPPNYPPNYPSLGPARRVGQVIRQREPQNLEFVFGELSEFLTPNEQFYVRSHFPTPTIDATNWRLTIEGAIQRPMQWTLEQIKQMPAETRIVTLECAGNGRIFLSPKVGGAQWELGAVSTAEWTGVRLRELLDRVGIKPDAVEIIFEGADEGHPDDPPSPPGKIHYARGLPLSKIDDVLLAYSMNGEPLPSAHGAPLRAIVGGWYGMASVKWLSRIVISTEPFRGYFQSVDYSYWDQLAGMAIRVPITAMKVKAQIARPSLHEVIPLNSTYRIVGAAWCGESDITNVEVSTDGGSTFSPATLLGEPLRYAWRFWEFHWRTPSQPGPQTLLARATDAAGNVQPPQHDPKFANYVIHHTLPIEVVVK